MGSFSGVMGHTPSSRPAFWISGIRQSRSAFFRSASSRTGDGPGLAPAGTGTFPGRVPA